MAALLMAIFLKGLTREETAALLDGMMAWAAASTSPSLGRPVIDKHSTGGVGDKVSLILAPLAAACGIAVPDDEAGAASGRAPAAPSTSSRAIPGFRTNLSLKETQAQIERIGCAIDRADAEIAPVDKKIYAPARRDGDGGAASC